MAGLEWKMVRSTGSRLEQALNELEAEGYEVAKIIDGDDQALQISIDTARARLTGEFVIVGKKATTI